MTAFVKPEPRRRIDQDVTARRKAHKNIVCHPERSEVSAFSVAAPFVVIPTERSDEGSLLVSRNTQKRAAWPAPVFVSKTL
jgi:hypothetical protein